MENRKNRMPVISLIALILLLCFGLIESQERIVKEAEVADVCGSLDALLSQALDARKAIEESFLNDVSFGDSSADQNAQVLREKMPGEVVTAGIYTNQGKLFYGFGEPPETVNDMSVYTRLMGHMRSATMLASEDDKAVLFTLVKLGDPSELSKSILFFVYPLTELDEAISEEQARGFDVLIIGNDGQYYDCQSREIVRDNEKSALSELLGSARKGESAGTSGSLRFRYDRSYCYGCYTLSESSIGILAFIQE